VFQESLIKLELKESAFELRVPFCLLKILTCDYFFFSADSI